MITVPKLALIAILIIAFGCIQRERSNTPPDQQILCMKVGDIREFNINGLSVIFKKSDGDTFDMSLLLLRVIGEKNSINKNLEELILRASLKRARNDTIVCFTYLEGFNSLAVQSESDKFETSLNNLLSVFYNQSFDSLLIDSTRKERDSKLDTLSDEDLQRYHADQFVTSRLLCIIEGNFSYKTVKSIIETEFYDKTVGEYSPRDLIYPENLFISKIRSIGLNSDSTMQKGVKN